MNDENKESNNEDIMYTPRGPGEGLQQYLPLSKSYRNLLGTRARLAALASM